MKTSRKGFTLIELLLVIGIIAILAAIVIVAINPTRQLGQARNAQRNSDINTVLNAVWQYAIDNNGTMPGSGAVTVDSTWRMVGDAASGCDVTAAATPSGSTHYCETANITSMDDACLDLDTLAGDYVVAIPYDPRYGSGSKTGYVIKNDSNRITVRSCYAEASQAVSEVTR